MIAVYKDKNDPSYKPDDPYTDLPFYSQNVAANGGSWNGGANKYEFSSNPIAIAALPMTKDGILKHSVAFMLNMPS